MTTALFLFAHQDDECGVFQAICAELKSGSEVYCCYFTSGTPSGSYSKRRDNESRRVLISLGINPNNIYFVGGEHCIPDGNLISHVNFAYDWILSFLKSNSKLVNVYLPAWEGGHPDHDVLHAAGVVAAKNANSIETTRQFPLYNGYHCYGLLFRTLLPLTDNGEVCATKIHFFSRLKFLGLCLKYPSQTKTWIGLFPFFLLHYLFWGTQDLQAVSLDRLKRKPHDGFLYYEKRKFSSWERINFQLNEFLEKIKT